MLRILFLFLFFPTSLFSQDFSFLSDESEAKHIAVDKDFYWVGTDNSLYQYSKEDGQLCGIFNQSNSPITRIIIMDTDRDGNLYVCTGHRLVRFENFDWVDYGNCSSNTSGLTFDENNIVTSTLNWNYTSPYCVGTPAIGFSEVKRGLTFSYGKFNWYSCNGSSSGCGCGQSPSQIRKIGNYFNDALLLSFPAYEEGHPDVLGNFWKSENNQLSTIFSPAGVPFYDTIESDTIFNLVGFTIQNHKILDNTSLGRFIYDGSNYIFLQPTFPFPMYDSFEDYEHKMFYLSEDKTPIAYIDDAWVNLEKPAGIPFANLSLVNSRGENLWFEHSNEKNFAMVTPTDYSYFTPTESSIPNLIPSLKINKISNEIWGYYSESGELWRHNGSEWLNYQATDLGLEEWNLTEYKISESGNLWFPLFDNPIAFFAEFDMSSQNWTVYNDSIFHNETFLENTDFWHFDEESFYHILSQDTTFYPFPIDLNYAALKHINESGHGWISPSPYSSYPMYYFNGENYTQGNGFGGSPFATFSRNDTLYMLNRPENENQVNPQIYYRKFVGEQLVYSNILATTASSAIHPYFSSVYPRLFGLDENNNLIIQIRAEWKTGLFNPPPVGYRTVLVTKTFSDNVIVPNTTFPPNFFIENAFFDNKRRLWSFNQDLGFICPYPLTPQNFLFGKNGDCSIPNYFLAGTLQGGSLPISYQWNDEDSLAYRLEVAEGDYTVTINNALGSEEAFQASIENNQLIEVEANVTNISEINATDGAISLYASSNFPPLSIIWSTGDTTFIIEELPFGHYSATITDANDCELVENYFVGGDSLVIDVEILNNIDCQENEAGSAIVNFPQSEPENYEILWSNGSMETMVENLSAGTNYVTVYSYSGITLIDTFYISDTSIDFFANYDTTVSSNEDAADGTAQIVPTGGTSPYSYQWSDGNMNAINENLSAGVHYLTVTDANDCFFVDSLTIYSQISVSVNILEQPICEDDETGVIEINVFGGTGNYNLTIPISNSGIIENLPIGTTVFSVIPELGDSVNYEVNIEPLSSPMDITIEVTLLNTEYAISPIVSGGTLPLTYAWITGETADTLFTSSSFFISQLTVTDAMGCSEALLINLNLPVILDVNDNISSDFQVFPNPAFDLINITLSDEMKDLEILKIINIQGKEVLSNLINEDINIVRNISHLPAGVYFVLLENEKQVMQSKFVKM